jgi:hypothetical protein
MAYVEITTKTIHRFAMLEVYVFHTFVVPTVVYVTLATVVSTAITQYVMDTQPLAQHHVVVSVDAPHQIPVVVHVEGLETNVNTMSFTEIYDNTLMLPPLQKSWVLV